MEQQKIRGHPPWYARGTPVIKMRDGPLIKIRGKPPLWNQPPKARGKPPLENYYPPKARGKPPLENYYPSKARGKPRPIPLKIPRDGSAAKMPDAWIFNDEISPYGRRYGQPRRPACAVGRGEIIIGDDTIIAQHDARELKYHPSGVPVIHRYSCYNLTIRQLAD